jgi:16S rRNA (adenine1518-N6/adenine1519-N6)-dimethyltransferase
LKKHYKGGVRAKKSLGQHFLRDEAVLNEITALSKIQKNSSVLEIGGGMGDLSRKIAPLCKKLFVIEKDKDMLPFLQLALKNCDAQIIEGDILRCDLEELLKNESSIQIAANLPYYLTTEIMERIFMLNLPIHSVSVMVQKEAGERLTAHEGSKKRGPLALLASLVAIYEDCVHVPAGCFTPSPKVDSVFLHFAMKEELPVPKTEVKKLYGFFKLCFSKRRKTLANNLTGIAAKEDIESMLESLGLRRDIRAESLPLEKFLEIAERLNITNL